MSKSGSHVLVIPSYNTGRILESTIREAIAEWNPVWLFIDGSTDQAHKRFLDEPDNWPGLKVFVSESNRGKGATSLWAADEAARAGFTHMLLMDADGQHPANQIQEFMDLSARYPEALIMGQPDFGPDAPWIRLAGRQLSVALTQIETLWGGLADPLFGFRVYPVEPLRKAFTNTDLGRRYDFDPAAAVHLYWQGIRPVRQRATVRYVSTEAGGISHFHYVRDNVTMVKLHLRLLPHFLAKLPKVFRLSRQYRAAARAAEAR
ncbi:MAG: glycosyltransferase [Verrucomicrobiota bacterium]